MTRRQHPRRSRILASNPMSRSTGRNGASNWPDKSLARELNWIGRNKPKFGNPSRPKTRWLPATRIYDGLPAKDHPVGGYPTPRTPYLVHAAECPASVRLGAKGLKGPPTPAVDWKGGIAGRADERGVPQVGSPTPRRFTMLPKSDTSPASSRVKHILFAEPTCATNHEPIGLADNSTSFPSVRVPPSNAFFSSKTLESPAHRNAPKTESRPSPGRSTGGGVGRGEGPQSPRR